MQNIEKIISLIDFAIKDEASNTISSGNIIRDWYDSDVDKYREAVYNSKNWLSSYQTKLIEKTSISKLKIKFTNQMWYFIEIPLSQKEKALDDFVHKQTLVNAIRYISSELKEFERNLIEGESLLASREMDLFMNIREEVLSVFKDIKNLSKKTSEIDMFSSFWNTAIENSYIRPRVWSKELLIKSWRHAVVEKIEKDFITNDLKLSEKEFIHLITGPNMWWKSTFLRQNALIILMSHLWSFVPAKKADIPLCDKLFSRVWASDNLFLGQSTFMLEMQEVANILNNSTKDSFIIIDEIWRWTSTYDGMSLAWAILKYIHDELWAKTLFATHYHELIDKSNELKNVWNYSVSVWETDDWIIFLRKLIRWWIKKSYWLEVAKLAWIKSSILKEASSMLKILELEHSSGSQLSFWNLNNLEIKTVEKEVIKESNIEKEIKAIDLNNLTPMEALNKLSELKEKLM